MGKTAEKKKTFVVQVLNNQNGTLQGTVTWLDNNVTNSFRSTLELIKLLDSTVGDKGE
ncbi:MAG: hypothetical protein LUG13_05615 [Oscillospiraceae bacterium]|nr:hypothetical protein [Oscillospiraceae bacterium]